jgi:heat shock protein 4
LKLLDETENWLYEDGENETKSVYVKKLEELHKLGNPITTRYYEHENRYDVLNTIRSVIQQFKLSATSEVNKYI